MKAGRELDALVAEKVFGCAVVFAHQTNDGVSWRIVPESGSCGCGDFRHNDPDPEAVAGLFEYSTSIAAAWEVVEKLTAYREDGEYFGLTIFSGRSLDPRYADVWLCEAWSRKDGKLRARVEGRTESLAICLAALKAVGAEVPK